MIFGQYPVSEELQGWVEENFLWAGENGLLSEETPLVLPTRAFFRAPGGESHAVAEAVLEDLKRVLGLEHEAITLRPLNMMSAEYRLDYSALSSVGGTWQADGNAGVIHYDPEMVKRPLPLISLLAHELMHHVLHARLTYPPGGPEAEELATDLHVITSGLGVLELAGAEALGWQGYMTQPTRAHALAVFLAVRGLREEAALSHLPPRAAKYLRRAVKKVAASGRAGTLRAALGWSG